MHTLSFFPDLEEEKTQMRLCKRAREISFLFTGEMNFKQSGIKLISAKYVGDIKLPFNMAGCMYD